jgi:hypothetical protein
MKPALQRTSAFTLLEVMLGVMILALVVMTIHRFLEANLMAMQMSTEAAVEERLSDGLLAVLQEQIDNLPRYEQGAIYGENHIFNDQPADEMTWICQAGSGLFTRFATGEYKVHLVIRPSKANSSQYDLGVERTPYDKTQLNDPNAAARLGQQMDWVPLIANVNGLEIRYFDDRLKAWVEKWTDPGSLPTMVRVRLWRNGEEETAGREIILQLPRGRNRIPMPGQQPKKTPKTLNPPNPPNPNGTQPGQPTINISR